MAPPAWDVIVVGAVGLLLGNYLLGAGGVRTLLRLLLVPPLRRRLPAYFAMLTLPQTLR